MDPRLQARPNSVRHILDNEVDCDVPVRRPPSVSSLSDERWWGNSSAHPSPAFQRAASFSSIPASIPSCSTSPQRNCRFGEHRSPSRSDTNACKSPPTINGRIAPRTIKVLLHVTVHTNWGDTAVVVGSAAPLGLWRPENALRLTTDKRSYPVWHADVPLECPQGLDSIEFKVAILRSGKGRHVEWEPLVHNRRLQFDKTLGKACERLELRWGIPDSMGITPKENTVPRGSLARETHTTVERCRSPSPSLEVHAVPSTDAVVQSPISTRMRHSSSREKLMLTPRGSAA